MNYETAKKLKEAGFPQKYLNIFDDNCKSHEHALAHVGACCGLYEPTLEELIEACGAVVLYVNGDDCRAESIEPANKEHSDWNQIWRKPIKGPTHKEAVANLYFALNKK